MIFCDPVLDAQEQALPTARRKLAPLIGDTSTVSGRTGCRRISLASAVSQAWR
jgi:hypothetical protein